MVENLCYEFLAFMAGKGPKGLKKKTTPKGYNMGQKSRNMCHLHLGRCHKGKAQTELQSSTWTFSSPTSRFSLGIKSSFKLLKRPFAFQVWPLLSLGKTVVLIQCKLLHLVASGKGAWHCLLWKGWWMENPLWIVQKAEEEVGCCQREWLHLLLHQLHSKLVFGPAFLGQVCHCQQVLEHNNDICVDSLYINNPFPLWWICPTLCPHQRGGLHVNLSKKQPRMGTFALPQRKCARRRRVV